MHRTKYFVGLFLLYVPQFLFAQEVRIVAPPGVEAIDGSLSVPNEANTVLRVQELWSASFFDELPDGGAWLVGFADRLDGAANSAASLTQDVTISVSTSPRDSIGLSYEQNFGDDVVEVLSGEVTRSYELSDGSPKLFGTPYVFDTPFFYDPSKGDLLLEIQFNGGRGSNVIYDSHNLGRPVGVFGPVNGSTATTFVNDHVVSEFIFDVPEPSSIRVGTVSFLGLLLCRRRRS